MADECGAARRAGVVKSALPGVINQLIAVPDDLWTIYLICIGMDRTITSPAPCVRRHTTKPRTTTTNAKKNKGRGNKTKKKASHDRQRPGIPTRSFPIERLSFFFFFLAREDWRLHLRYMGLLESAQKHQRSGWDGGKKEHIKIFHQEKRCRCTEFFFLGFT